MARPRKKTEEETPQAEETEATEAPEPEAATEADAPAEEAPAEEAPAEVADEPVAEAEQPVVAEPEPEPSAEEAPADEPAAETEAPAAEPAPPAAPAKPKRVRKPKEFRRARTQARKAKRAAASDGKRKPITRLPKPERIRGQRKERRGVVVSNAMEKTIVVRVDTAKPHRRYKKVVRLSQKIHAHDERNEANIGDVVRIVETRPLSKTKRWRLAEVVEQAR
jgi:small subunit ribosomal protein S17